MNTRPMTPADIEFAFNCTQKEGWISETREIFQEFLAYDPDGCLVAEHAGKPAGMCVAVMYQVNGFIGELIVVPEMRGRGFGQTLFAQAMDYLQRRGARSIFLDGDLEAVPIYEKAGFRKACRSLRFYGLIKNTIDSNPNITIRRMEEHDMQAVYQVDRELFGDDRSFFLKKRCEHHPDLCFLAEKSGQIAGYIMGRPGEGLLTVGPWAVLDIMEHPEALLERLACEAHGRPLRMGILETNQQSMALLRSYPSLEEGEFSWRMAWAKNDQTGASAGLSKSNRLYAIGSAAKG